MAELSDSPAFFRRFGGSGVFGLYGSIGALGRLKDISAFSRVHAARMEYFLRRVLRRPSLDFREVALEREVLSPEEVQPHAKPRMPREHLNRIRRGWDGGPADAVIASLLAETRTHAATVVYTLADVAVIGARLLSGRAYMDLCRGRAPLLGEVEEFESVTLASTWTGAKWFGHFIHDELPLQLLAAELGNPVAHARPAYRDEPAYRNIFNVRAPRTVPGFYARRCRVIVDYAQNASKRARYGQLRNGVKQCGGPRQRVYLQRGGGSRRVLREEAQLMDELASRGFRILNNTRDSVFDIADACSRAQQIVTLDGSHAAPALLLAPPGAELLVISPANRVSDILLDIGEAAGLRTAFFVAESSAEQDVCSVAVPELLRFIEA